MEINSRKNARSLKSAIEAAYKQAESDLFDKGPGYTGFIQAIGSNVRALTSSHDNQ